MSDADELVSRWVVDNFQKKETEAARWRTYPISTERSHLGFCSSTKFTTTEHGWECGCYSSVTREDTWRIHGSLSCQHGFEMRYDTYAWEWQNGLPGALKDMIKMDELDCPYESEEDDW